MRRLGRWVFILAAALSLLVWLPFAVLWVRSYWVGDQIAVQPTLPASVAVRRSWTLSTGRGVCILGRMEIAIGGVTHPPVLLQAHTVSWSTRPAVGLLKPWVYRIVGGRPQMILVGSGRTDVIQSSSIYFPLWIPTFVLAMLPGLFVWRAYRARRRPAPGCCKICGYDLRATPDRCPECGTIPESITQDLTDTEAE